MSRRTRSRQVPHTPGWRPAPKPPQPDGPDVLGVFIENDGSRRVIREGDPIPGVDNRPPTPLIFRGPEYRRADGKVRCPAEYGGVRCERWIAPDRPHWGRHRVTWWP